MRKPINYNFSISEVKALVKKWYPKVKKFLLNHLKGVVITILVLLFLVILKGCF